MCDTFENKIPFLYVIFHHYSVNYSFHTYYETKQYEITEYTTCNKIFNMVLSCYIYLFIKHQRHSIPPTSQT